MLVLDEQLLNRDLETAPGRWYCGPVLFITDLWPGTVIKDDAIPVLLRQQRQRCPSETIAREGCVVQPWLGAEAGDRSAES
jgi:hypothetical protein